MTIRAPTDQEILDLARGRLAEQQKREEEAKAARDAELREKDRYVQAFTGLLQRLEAIIRPLVEQGVPIDVRRSAENRAAVSLPAGARILTAELFRTPAWIGMGPLNVMGEAVRGGAYFGVTLNDRGVTDAVIGCNFLWMLAPGAGAGSERWLTCWTKLSAGVAPQLIATRYGISVPPSPDTAFGIPFDDVLYEQLRQAGALHTIGFEFSEDPDAGFRQVLATALKL